MNLGLERILTDINTSSWEQTLLTHLDDVVDLIHGTYGVDLSHVTLKVDDTPVYPKSSNGKKQPQQKGGLGTAVIHVKNPYIVIVHEGTFEKSLKYWGMSLSEKINMVRHIIAHELLHFIVDKYSKRTRNSIIKKLGDFDTVYSESVTNDNKDKETIVEFLTLKLLGKLPKKYNSIKL